VDLKPVSIQLQGFTHVTESFRNALRHSKSNDAVKSTWPIVLFCFCMQNYLSMPGVRLNTPSFSGHPQEREVILIEGI